MSVDIALTRLLKAASIVKMLNLQESGSHFYPNRTGDCYTLLNL